MKVIGEDQEKNFVAGVFVIELLWGKLLSVEIFGLVPRVRLIQIIGL